MPRLPLSHPYFDTPSLPANVRQHMIDEAKETCRDTIRQVHAMNLAPVYNEMTNSKTKRRLTLRLGQDLVDPRLLCMSGHTQVSCTIEEVADFYHTNTIQRAFGDVVGTHVLDRTCLYPLIHRQQIPEDPLHYIAINWMAMQMPSVIADRDFCYLECHDEFKDGLDRRRGWARSVHSVMFPGCPPLDEKFGVTRGSLFRSGQVFIENGETPGLLDMYHVACVELHGVVSHDIQLAVLVQFIEESLNVDEYFRTVNLSHCRLLAMPNTIPKTYSCASCEVPFKTSIFTSVKRHLCRICGHIVCPDCSDQWNLLYKKPIRICAPCVERSKDSRKDSHSAPLMTYYPGSPVSVVTSQSDGSNHQSTPRGDELKDDLNQKIDMLLEEKHLPRTNSNKVVLFDSTTFVDESASESSVKLRELLKSHYDGNYNADAIKQVEAALM